MNILMLVKDSQIGGVMSCVQSLTEGLIKKGDHVVIGSSDGEGVDQMLAQYEVRIIDFTKKNIIQMIKNYQLLRKIVREENIDIIHAQNRIPALYAAIYCFFHRKVKYIWSNHLVPIPCIWKHKLTTRYGKFAVAEGVTGRDFLVHDFKIPESKVRVVNLESDLKKFTKISAEQQKVLKNQWSIKDTDKVLLLYGRLMPVKGHLFLLEALTKLPKDRRKELRVIFPGENDEYRKQIDQYAEEHQLTEMLIYPGYINGREYLSISDLMVLPSIKEGFGIVNVGAFAMGVPVIRTKTAGYLDMEDCCFGVEYGDAEDLAKYISCLWDNPEMLSQMATVATEKVDRFSVEKMTDDYRAIYEECLS